MGDLVSLGTILAQADCILSASLSPKTPALVCSPAPMHMHGAEPRQLCSPSLAPDQSCGLRSDTVANAILGWGVLLVRVQEQNLQLSEEAPQARPLKPTSSPLDLAVPGEE